jgi:hypothetical protein
MPCEPGYRPAERIDSLSSGECVKEGGERDMLFWILVIFAIVALAGGGWGYGRYGYVGFSPLAVILVILLILLLTGNLRL